LNANAQDATWKSPNVDEPPITQWLQCAVNHFGAAENQLRLPDAHNLSQELAGFERFKPPAVRNPAERAPCSAIYASLTTHATANNGNYHQVLSRRKNAAWSRASYRFHHGAGYGRREGGVERFKPLPTGDAVAAAQPAQDRRCLSGMFMASLRLHRWKMLGRNARGWQQHAMNSI
jgi:hypothetical protein